MDQEFIDVIYEGDLDDIRDVLVRGPNIDINRSDALAYSAQEGNLDIVRFLVEGVVEEGIRQVGADIHGSHDEPLRWAIQQGNLEIVRYLLEHGANINAIYPQFNRFGIKNEPRTVLGHWFDNHINNLDVLRYLVEEGGADVNLLDGDAIKYAVNGYMTYVRLQYPVSNQVRLDAIIYLLQHGANYKFLLEGYLNKFSDYPKELQDEILRRATLQERSKGVLVRGGDYKFDRTTFSDRVWNRTLPRGHNTSFEQSRINSLLSKSKFSSAYKLNTVKKTLFHHERSST